MAKRATFVRMSSKGQIVVPAEVRRSLGFRTGQALAVRRGPHRELIFQPVEDADEDLDGLLRRARAWFAAWRGRTGRDPLDEFHERRRREREKEARERERRRP